LTDQTLSLLCPNGLLSSHLGLKGLLCLCLRLLYLRLHRTGWRRPIVTMMFPGKLPLRWLLYLCGLELHPLSWYYLSLPRWLLGRRV
jgi:hypothetical protein